MKLLRFILPAAGGILIALLLLLRPTSHTVTILVENQPIIVTTQAKTVEAALKEAGVHLTPEDEITPSPDTRIREGLEIQLIQAMQVAVTADGKTERLTTTARIPADWLDALGIEIGADDHVTINGAAIPIHQPISYQAKIQVEVQRAVTYTLIHGNEKVTLKSAAPSLGQALWEAGVTLTESDLLEPGPETPLTDSLTAYLTPGKQIQVAVDGRLLNLTTSASTVGAALTQVGLPVQGLDYSVPDLEAPIPADGKIQIVRVQEEVLINQEPIAFTTLYEPVEDLEIDNFTVLQLGQSGIQAQRVRVRYEDGVETSRNVEDQWTLQEPVSRIEGYGTKIVIRTAQTADGTIEYWRAVEMYATSYSPCNLGVDWCSDTTASGLKVRKGLAALTIEWYRYMAGQTVYVPDYGYALIADVGGGIDGRYWIDLAYTDEEWFGWHFWRTVYFLTPVPPADQILYILP